MLMPLNLTADYQPPGSGYGAKVWLHLNGQRFLGLDVPRDIAGDAFEQMAPERIVWLTVTEFVQVMHIFYVEMTDGHRT